jgi:hypothetical protein
MKEVFMDLDNGSEQNDFFDRYFQDALIIRAICDDFNFPAEYSPVFVNIHIRGPEHFRSPPLPGEHYKIVFDFLDPSFDNGIKKILSEMGNTPVKDLLNKLCVKNKVRELDQLLKNNEGKSNYLSNQIQMIKKLYFDFTFMEQMIALYTFFVKPYIKEYNDEKIARAFQKAKIRDINQEINDFKQGDIPED